MSLLQYSLISVLASGLGVPSLAMSSAVARPLEIAQKIQDTTVPGKTVTFRTNIAFYKGKARQPARMELINGVPLVKIRIAKHDGWALLDNRFEQSEVDVHFARANGIPVGRSISPLRTPTGELPRWLAAAVPFEVPGQFGAVAPFAAANLEAISRTVGRPISMVIGHEYFAEMIVAISSTHGILQFGPGGSKVTGNGAEQVLLLNDRPQLRIMAGDQPLLVTLDLGYNGSLALSDEAWHRLKLDTLPTSSGQTMHADGHIFSVAHATASAVRIGDELIGDIQADRQPLLPEDGDGLLGMGILARFDVIIDTRAGILWLSPTERH